MLDGILKFKNESSITFVPKLDYKYYDSINYSIKNAIKIEDVYEDKQITDAINNSAIKKAATKFHITWLRFCCLCISLSK